MAPLEDHPRRFEMANELHARPFPRQSAPARVAYLAIRATGDAARRDRGLDRAHLISLLDRFGAPHPAPDATHYMGEIGKYSIKWESHTEFVTYTLFANGTDDKPFDRAVFDLFPEEWLAQSPGQRVTSILFRIEEMEDMETVTKKLDDWFEPESLAAAQVIDADLMAASDFRIDEAGHMRFAIFAAPACGDQRIGRLLQRLCDIEIYKSMSMLGLVQARRVNAEMALIETELSALMERMTDANVEPDEAMLNELLGLSTRIETLVTQTNFRFGATGAYETLVTQRIEVLNEQKVLGRQTFAEFMLRRFDPAMRTTRATKSQLESLATRAARAANLLRTKVDVSRQAQNQAVLTSMDRRADLQLRLQETVEGLSVVAISYYAVGLVGYLVYPFLEPLGVSKGVAMAGLTLPVVLLVWAALRRVKRQYHA